MTSYPHVDRSVAGPRPASPDAGAAPLHLRAGGVSVVLDARGPALPRVVHWGADLGHLTGADLVALADAARPGVVSGSFDEPAELTLLPLPSGGWTGRPGLAGDRAGTAWSPAFTTTETARTRGDETHEVVTAADDPSAALRLILVVRLEPSGLLRMCMRLRNLDERPYALQALRLTLPVPSEAGELLDLAGRHLHERTPQRHPFTVGTHERESRRGRPGLDGSLVFGAGVPGFGFRAGEVWTVHLGWSGSQHAYAERLADGRRLIGAGETLLPGELSLLEGEEYATPWLYAAYGDGLDEAARRVHAHLRSRTGHPTAPRPVVFNTWEAVYFEQTPARLAALVEVAAEVGAERFVLDDGWQRGRRDDTTALGDWEVDPQRWPDGLHPLVKAVRAHGMSFGLWVEPEMISLDSDLYRAHPDWVLAADHDRMPASWRHQQVLDLTRPEAFEHVLGRLDALVTEYAIDYLKWDHNRDVGEPGRRPRGEPVGHRQALAAYRMIDTLRARHPGLEIESSASGGGRIDLGILRRTDRVWPSDCNDALERQSIQRWTQQLLPPELVASHVGAPGSHSTGRVQDLTFRAGTALFGHFGIEWDLTRATDGQRAELAGWVALYKRLRPLLHGGRVVRADHPDPALWVHGVVADDAVRAVYAVVAVATALTAPPGRVRLPGLAPDGRYRLAPLPPGDRPAGVNHALPRWFADGGCVLTGRALAIAGVQIPDLYPQQLLLLDAERVG